MRILFLTERFPMPLSDGGNLRTYHLLRGLSQEHEVTLVAHQREEVTRQQVEQVAQFCRVEMVPRPGRFASLARGAFRGTFLNESFFAAKNWSSPLLSRTIALLKEHKYHAIHFNQLDTACYALKYDWDLLQVFDTHNCLHEMAKTLTTESEQWYQRLFYKGESQRLLKLEQQVSQRMDAIMVCSQEDAACFRKLSGRENVHVVPNGVDCAFFDSPETNTIEPGSMVFVGAMGYFPNHDAAVYFCRDVLPRLSHLKPSPVIYFVGKDPPRALQALHDGQRVIVTGRVEDVRPYVAKAMFVVVPLRHGGGTRLKILEAFSMGKTVVSTTKGAEGIPAEPGREIFLASDTDELVEKINLVWKQPDFCIKVGNAARELVRSRFDWQAIAEQARNVYRTLATSPAHQHVEKSTL